MDPITQIAAGAAVAVAISPKDQTRLAAFLGAVAGAAPDLDLLIRSDSDPFLGLQYHRHFSHALVTIPVIGFFIAAICRLLMFRSKVPFKKYMLYATAGVLTHGPIDACTSYGTLLYWPFSDQRVSWNLISIIDPIFTVPLVFLTFLAFKWQRPFFAQLAVMFCLIYLGFCGYQNVRAKETLQNLAVSRSHIPYRYSVRPSMANNVLWRTIYWHNKRYYVDAVWIVPGEEPRLYKGSSVPEFTFEDAARVVAPDSVVGRDIERFRYFSQGYLYLYRSPGETNVLGDLRYSVYPDSIVPLWGIMIDPERPESHAKFKYFRRISKSYLTRFWKMVQGQKVEQLRY